MNVPNDVKEHGVLVGHGGAIVGLHEQGPCLGALLKLPCAFLWTWQRLCLRCDASFGQAAHALPASKVLLCQVPDLHHVTTATDISLATIQVPVIMVMMLIMI